MEILRMRGKELNELTEEFMLAESKMNDLLPQVKFATQKLVRQYKEQSFSEWYGSIPKNVYDTTIDSITTLSTKVIETRLYKSFIPIFYFRPVPKATAQLFKLIQIRLQIEQYKEEHQEAIFRLEKTFQKIDQNNLGAIANMFQSRDQRLALREQIGFISDYQDFIEDFSAHAEFWENEVKQRIPIRQNVHKSRSFYLLEIYKNMHPFSETMLKQPEMFGQLLKTQAEKLQEDIQQSGYGHWHQEMLSLWNKLKHEQAQKDISAYSISLLSNGKTNFPNIKAMINDGLTLNDLTTLTPQELKEQYQLPLADTQEINYEAKAVITKLTKQAVPKFNADELSFDKLQFLALLKFCNEYPQGSISFQQRSIQLIDQFNNHYQAMIDLCPTHFEANFLDKDKYASWLAYHDCIYQDAQSIFNIRDELHLDRSPEGNLDAVKQDFIQNGALYFTLIEKLSGQSANYATATLPKAIVEQVLNYPLVTKNLLVKMRKYQDFGTKYILSYRNVLLGDEMGLGKTIQAIAVANHLYQIGQRHAIVVCPLSILENWKSEIHKWSKLNAYTYRGAKAKRDKEYDTWLYNGGILLTNYEQCFHLVKKKDKPAIDLLVVDEAHYIKNPQTNRAKHVKELANIAEYKLFMSGTPLENNLVEMMQLIDILNPTLSKQIRKDQNRLTIEQFKERLATVYLRRKRKEVLQELPKMSIIERWSSFTDEEQKFYDKCVDEASLSGLGALVKMRRAAFIDDESEKIAQIKEIAQEAKDMNRKVIVFSFFKNSVLKRLAMLLPTSMEDVLSGDLSPGNRQKLIDKFNQSTTSNVLLAQIEAGGVGLNIQTANIVILCEPQWKPSTEQQAISRVYRMGQTRDVIVYRLLTKDSIDESMVDLIDIKQDIFDTYANDSALQDAFKKHESDEAIKEKQKKILEIEKKRLKFLKNKKSGHAHE